jgi:hypothetical protein
MVALFVISLGLAVWVFRLRTRLTVLEHRDALVASRTGAEWELTVTVGWLNSTGRRVAVIALALLAAYSVAMLFIGWLLALAF